MGIAAAHFDFAAKEKGIRGYFAADLAPNITLPKNMDYCCSWFMDEFK